MLSHWGIPELWPPLTGSAICFRSVTSGWTWDSPPKLWSSCPGCAPALPSVAPRFCAVTPEHLLLYLTSLWSAETNVTFQDVKLSQWCCSRFKSFGCKTVQLSAHVPAHQRIVMLSKHGTRCLITQHHITGDKHLKVQNPHTFADPLLCTRITHTAPHQFLAYVTTPLDVRVSYCANTMFYYWQAGKHREGNTKTPSVSPAGQHCHR